MIDLRLRAPDEAALRADLAAAAPYLVWQDAAGQVALALAGEGYALHPYGPNIDSPPEFEPATREVIAPGAVDGRFHANLRLWGDQAEPRAAALSGPAHVEGTEVVSPASPSVVWA